MKKLHAKKSKTYASTYLVTETNALIQRASKSEIDDEGQMWVLWSCMPDTELPVLKIRNFKTIRDAVWWLESQTVEAMKNGIQYKFEAR